jgi:hypothetical protein
MPDDENVYQHIISLARKRELGTYETAMSLLMKRVQADPSSIVAFASLVMETCPKGGTFFDTALSFLPLHDWPIVIEQAMRTLRADPENKAAHSILECANLQCPPYLQPYAEEITAIAFVSDDLSFAVFDDPPSLYPPHSRHLAFPAPYLAELLEKRSAKAEDRCHPTWIETPKDALTFPFGGRSEAICNICSQRLHHLITFDPISDGLGVTGLESIELSVCLACLTLGCGVLSYQHDEHGSPHDISQDRRWPQFAQENTSFSLKPNSVALVDLGPRWQRQDWGASNRRENLHRVGGHPTWIQHAEYVSCPRCHDPSTFLMQLDEGLLTADEGTGEQWCWDWSGGGMGYVLWCDRCKVSSILEQYT